MSERLALLRTSERLRALFAAHGTDYDGAPSWNVRPGRSVPAVCRAPPGRVVRSLRWGFRAGNGGDGQDLATARCETVTSSRLFAEAFRLHRCLVPADVFYRRLPDADRGTRTWAFARMDGRPAAIASFFAEADGPEAGSLAILTLPPSGLSADAERIPLLVEEEDWGAWLGEHDVDPETLLRPTPLHHLRAWPVGPGIDDPARDDPGVLEPID